MGRRLQGGLAAGAALAIGGGWEVVRRRDRAAVRHDPMRSAFKRELEGERLDVRSKDGTRLEVRAFGDPGAPVVVLIHGWTCAWQFWTLQIQGLQADHRVIAYDLRGHGESEGTRDGEWTMDAFAHDLDAVLEAALEPGERAVVCGHSLGGMTVMAWADLFRDLVEERLHGAVLASTGAYDLIAESLLFRLPVRGRRLESLLGRVVLGAQTPLPHAHTPLSHRAVRYIALCPEASPAAVAFCEDIVLNVRRDVRGLAGATISRLDLRDAIHQITVPSLVVSGKEDRLTPPVHAERLAAELPDCRGLISLEHVGHMTPVEAPDAVDGAIRRLVPARVAS